MLKVARFVPAVFLSVIIAVSLAAETESADQAGASAGKSVRSPAARPMPPWRALSDYPRPPAPDTGWGIHDNPQCMWKPADPDSFFKELRKRYGFTWFKVLDCGTNKLDLVRAARRQGVEPVVRIYVGQPTPHYPRAGEEEARFRQAVKDYVAAGARYFEAGNEPNLTLEWSEGEWEKAKKEGKLTERVCAQWLRVRPMISESGGIPVFYAMSVGGEDGRSAGEWWDDCFKTFKKWNKIEEAFAGCAFGAHLGPLNHPLDYPFDEKRNMPHATQEERIDSLMKNNTCYLGIELLIHLMDQYLPHRIPVLSTEGGAFPDNHGDKQYPPVTPERHAELNMGIFERMNPAHPEYWGDPLFAQMSWIYHASEGIFAIDSWFDNPKYGRMPILDAMERAKKFDRGSGMGKTAPRR